MAQCAPGLRSRERGQQERKDPQSGGRILGGEGTQGGHEQKPTERRVHGGEVKEMLIRE